MKRASKRRYLLLILALALAGRVALLTKAWQSDAIALGSPDSASYLSTAKSLSADGTFRTDGRPELFRTPGYPAFLAACGATGPWGYGIAQAFQVLLDVLLVYLTYVLGVWLISESVGLWAAAFQAVSFVAALGSLLILSDSLFAFLMTTALLLLVRHLRRGTWWPVALAAVVTAAAAYVRPVGFIFVPIAVLVLLARRGRLANAGGFALVFAVLVIPWCIRNYVVAGYAGFSSVGEHNLLYYEATGVTAKVRGVSTLEAREDLDSLFRQRRAALNIPANSAEAARLQGRMGREIVLSHPGTWLVVHVKTSVNSLLPAGTGLLEILGITSGSHGTLSVLHTEGIWSAVKHYFSFGPGLAAVLWIVPELVLLAVRYLACLAYAVRQLWRQKLNWGAAGWLVVLTILAFVLVAGPAAVPRFRAPVEPLVNLGAAAGLVWLARRRSAGKAT